MKLILGLFILSISLSSCGNKGKDGDSKKENTKNKSHSGDKKDFHSYSNVVDVNTTHLHLVIQ